MDNDFNMYTSGYKDDGICLQCITSEVSTMLLCHSLYKNGVMEIIVSAGLTARSFPGQ